MTDFLSIPIMFTLCLIATGSYGQEDVDFTHISFSSETEFLISVEEVVSQQTQPSKGAAAIKLFSGDSAQTNSSNLEQLISALPIPASDVVESVERLDILGNKIWTRKLQRAVLDSVLKCLA